MEEKNSKLDETIGELVSKTQCKSKYLERMKKDHENFSNEASMREDEFKKIISQNDETIEKLMKDISTLKTEFKSNIGKVSVTLTALIPS